MLKTSKVVIVGLGLMGASLALAIRKRFPKAKVIGLSRSLETIHAAREKGVVHWGSTNLKEVVQDADWVVVCTPIHTLPEFIGQIDLHAKPGTLVMDVASAKGELMDWADRQKFQHIRFVGAHPMAGSHERGLNAGRADLYDNSLTFVIHSKRTDLKALEAAVRFWKYFSREVHVTSPKEHDRIVAKISHLPHVLSSLLVHGTDPKSLPFVGPGFRDTTRISKSDPELWQEIIRANKSNIEHELKAFRSQIDKFLDHLEDDKTKHIRDILDKASKKRAKIDPKSR